MSEMSRVYKRIRMIVILCVVCALFSPGMAVYASSDSMQLQDNQVSLTREEQEYVEEHPTIVIAADASWRPLEYLNEGRYSGVIAEILTRLESYTGFQFEYQVKDSYAEALEAVRTGEADMVSGVADDPDIAKKYQVDLSDAYLTINSAIVAKTDAESLYNNTQKKNIAVVEGDYANDQIQDRIENASLVPCASNQECLNMVRSGKVDMAIIASYCAEYYMSVPKYSNLKSHTIADFTWQQSFGVNGKEDPRLLQIMNKGIQKISSLDLNEAVYEGIIHASYDNDLMVFIYKHPILVIGLVLSVVLVIGFLLFLMWRARKKEHMREVEDGTRLKLALERTHLCIWELDLHTGKINQIDNVQEKHGFQELRENIPQSVIEHGYIHPEDITQVEEVLDKVKNGEQNVQGCWRVLDKTTTGKDSVYWWEQVLFHIIYDEQHRPVKAIGVSEDVTREKNAQRDSLTLVYNRSSFEQKANQVLCERRNAYLQCAYLILDLDGFKQINDTYGHGMGDRVLISVGAALNKTFRSTDIVGRLGGDEFTVFMTSISKCEDAMRKAQELVDNVSNVQKRDDYPFPVSCSVGVVVGTKGLEDLATLYKKADTALYEAKRAGKNQYRLYE